MSLRTQRQLMQDFAQANPALLSWLQQQEKQATFMAWAKLHPDHYLLDLLAEAHIAFMDKTYSYGYSPRWASPKRYIEGILRILARYRRIETRGKFSQMRTKIETYGVFRDMDTVAGCVRRLRAEVGRVYVEIATEGVKQTLDRTWQFGKAHPDRWISPDIHRRLTYWPLPKRLRCLKDDKAQRELNCRTAASAFERVFGPVFKP